MDLQKQLSQDSVVLISINPQKYGKTANNVARIVSRSGPGVYVTVNKPFAALKDGFAKNGINPRAMFFIDMVARPFETKTETNCLYIGPDDLTGVSIAIDHAISAIQGKKFVVFDTVNTLLNYNNEFVVIRFIHSLTGKMRRWNAKGILLSVGMDAKITAQLSQFCDKCIVMN